MDPKITVVINTYNAANTLKTTIDSVGGGLFDEVLVCDMESTDDTLEIARSYGCRIVTFPKAGHTCVEPARMFALQHAAHDYVLVVDADEIVPRALRDYLYGLLRRPEPPAGVWIPRRNYFLGRFMHGTYPDHILRFIRREGCTWAPHAHAIPQVAGRVERIPASRRDLAFIHVPHENMSVLLKKADAYTESERIRRRERGERATLGKLIVKPAFIFFKLYILKGGFRDGTPGFIRAAYNSFYKFVSLSKMYEDRIGAAEYRCDAIPDCGRRCGRSDEAEISAENSAEISADKTEGTR